MSEKYYKNDLFFDGSQGNSIFNTNRKDTKQKFDITNFYDEIATKFGVLFILLALFTAIITFIYIFWRLFFSFTNEDRQTKLISEKTKLYILKHVNFRCSECKKLSYNDIARFVQKFSKSNDVLVNVWNEITENDEAFEILVDENGMSWVKGRTMIPNSLFCLLFRNKTFIFLSLVSVSICVFLGLQIYLKFKNNRQANEYSSQIIQTMVAQSKYGTRDINPQSLRIQYPKVNDKQWRNIVNQVERCPIVSVYRKKNGNIWQVSGNN